MNCEPLKKVCKIYNGNSINADFKKKNFAGLKEGYPFIATKDVSFSGSIDYDNGIRIPYDTKYKIAPAGSIFICAEGGSAGRKIARVGEPVCFGNKLFCLVPGDRINSDYLYHYLLSDKFQSQFKFLMSGLIGGVSAKKFGDIIIEFPSPNEQKSIVAKLDAAFAKIDKVIANAADALNEAQNYFATSLCDSFVPKEKWLTASVEKLAVDVKYGTSKPSHANGEYVYLRMNNISNDGHLVLKDLKYISLPEKELEKCIVRKGDILFNRTNSYEHVGKTCVFNNDTPMVIAGYIIRIRLNDKIIPEFFSYFMNSACTKRNCSGTPDLI